VLQERGIQKGSGHMEGYLYFLAPIGMAVGSCTLRDTPMLVEVGFACYVLLGRHWELGDKPPGSEDPGIQDKVDQAVYSSVHSQKMY
jgi:hypothetical protein